MAATEGTGSVKYIGTPQGTGSVQSDWQLAHANAAAADTAALLYTPGSTSVSTNVQSLVVPFGATRAIIKGRLTLNATLSTNLAVVRLMTLDANDVPDRVDATPSTSAGLSLTFSTTATNNVSDATYRYSDPVSLTGIDVLGGRKALVMVSTADGHTAADHGVLIKFLN
jgi:hypothetical protein